MASIGSRLASRMRALKTQADAVADAISGSLSGHGARPVASLDEDELATWWAHEAAKPRIFDDVSIVAIGGAAMFGRGVSDPDQAFIARVAKDIARELAAPMHLCVLAGPHAGIDDVLTQQIPHLSDAGEPDLVVVCLDPEELTTTPIDEYVGKLGLLIEKLPYGSVIAEFPRCSDPHLNDLGATVNLRLRRTARSQGHIVARIRDMQGMQSIYTNPDEMAIGTNATMDHARWADAIWTAIWASSRFDELR